MVVLLVHDFVLTLPDEVALVWHRKLSAVSTVVIMNRVAAAIVCVSFVFPWDTAVCGRFDL